MSPLTLREQELYDWLVEYFKVHDHCPTIRQMVEAMGLKSNSPIQERLKHLKHKGYIAWEEGKARTLRLLRPGDRHDGLYLWGTIAAGGVVESFTDFAPERVEVPHEFDRPDYYALKVMGESMLHAHICDGDLVIMRPVTEPQSLKEGKVVAARVDGEGVTLKHFHREGDRIILMPANPSYAPIVRHASQVTVQGALVAVWRQY